MIDLNHNPITHEIFVNGRRFKLADDRVTDYERRELVKDAFRSLLDLNDRAHRISEASERLAVAEDELRALHDRHSLLKGLFVDANKTVERMRQWRGVVFALQSMLEDGKTPARMQKWLEKELLKPKYAHEDDDLDEDGDTTGDES